jgi:signal recognition particle subunit SRP68
MKAYCKLLSAHYEMQMGNYKSGLDQFKETTKLYSQLILIAASAHHKTLCQGMIDEIEPCIRYCAYNLRQEFSIDELLEMKNTIDTNDVVTQKIQRLLGSQIETKESTIHWRGKTLKISGKILESIYEINNLKIHLDSCNISEKQQYFDKLIGIYWEATEIAQKAVSEDKVYKY